MTQQFPKRLIEVDLPIKRISAHSRREKSIRHGHISTLHIWWARRPLAACRAVICAALWPDPADPLCPQDFRDRASKIITEFAKAATTNKALGESCDHETWIKWQALTKTGGLDSRNEAHWNVLRFALLDFIADFANWDNSTVQEYLNTGRALTQAAHEALGGEPDTRPLVVDPFAGGGSIPLEALRVGADTFASDLNPVAVLLNKVVLEFTPKYGNRLADEIRKSAEWIREEAESELGNFYPLGPEDATPIAYIWARVVLSEAPGQGNLPVEIPLIRSMWLAKRSSKRQALRWLRDKRGQVVTHRHLVTYADGATREVLRPQLEVFTPSKESEVGPGTSAGGSATCPVTGFTMSVERVRHQLEPRKGGASDNRLISIVELRPSTSGRLYRIPHAREEEMLGECKKWIERYAADQAPTDPHVPHGELNHLRGFFNIVLYGMKTWGDLFNPRQLAVLLILSKLVRKAGGRIEDPELSLAVEVCLSLVIGRMADGNSSLARWQPTGEKISNTFGRQALPMVWDYAEANPFCDATRSLESMFAWIIGVIVHESSNPANGHAEQASATAHSLPNDSADIVVTDPPYYAAVPYADLSDFFYSWLVQALRPRLPELFALDLTPKAEECVQLSHRAAMYRNKDKAWFEKVLAQACSEAQRVTKPPGAGLFVFASKETNAWEAMLTALVSTGWVVTASWPVDTEMSSRLRAQGSATLASSVHIFCRPRQKLDGITLSEVGDWREVLQALPVRIHQWMPRLADEGIVGADAIFACLGPAIEVFSRFSRVEKASGDAVTLREYLEHVWAAVAKEALAMVFKGADATGFEADARLTAMWLWTLKSADTNGDLDEQESEVNAEDESETKRLIPNGLTLEFDAARKIAQGLGADLESLRHLVRINGDQAHLLPVSERTQHLFGKDEEEPNRTIGKRKRTAQLDMFAELTDSEAGETAWREKTVKRLGDTTLDRVHQGMILFAAGRGEALKRFVVEDGVGRDGKFWRLAQALSALYPSASDEKRWVDGVLARKKQFGF